MNGLTNDGAGIRLPLGSRASHGKPRWYFVACAEGEEVRTCRKVVKILPSDLLRDAFVPLAEHAVRGQGTGSTCLRSIFDGYFVAVTDNANELAQQLARLTFYARMAGAVGDDYAPMDEDAEQFLTACMDNMHVVRMSKGEYVRGNLRVLRGPLAGQEKRIRRVEHDAMAAYVRVGLKSTGEGFAIVLPLEVNNAVSEGVPRRTAKLSAHEAAVASFPMDQRTPKDQPRWYLATCAAGYEEEAVADMCSSVAPEILRDAFVPYMEQQRKVRGVWERREVPMIKGVFVVITTDVRRLAARLALLRTGVSVVGDAKGRPAPMAEEAVEFLNTVMDAEHVVRLSWAEIIADELRISDGPLKGCERRVASFNRGKCFAMVRACEGDDEHLLKLPLAITARY